MSHLQCLIEERIGGSLSNWLSSAKSEGMSYREIAKSLSEETGIKVSKSAVHYWLHNQKEEK